MKITLLQSKMWALLKQSPIDLTILLIVAYGTLGYLSLRGAINTSALILFALALFSLIFSKRKYDSTDLLIFTIFSSLFFSSLISQIARNDYQISSLDGPSRILVAGVVFIWLRDRNIDFLKLFELVLPLSLLVLAFLIHLNEEWSNAWKGHFATGFVDPNSLGSQTAILCIICFGLIKNIKDERLGLILFKILGGFAGLYISFFAQSRGGWIALPFMIFSWFFFLLFGSKRIKDVILFFCLFCLLCFFILFLIFENSIVFKTRIEQLIHDILIFNTHPMMETSFGLRLRIWEIASLAFRESPWFGYGENSLKIGIISIMKNTPDYLIAPLSVLVNTGPHSDILAKSLASGILGLFSYLGLIFGPMYLFFKQSKSINKEKRFAGKIGILLTTGFFICGLSNENLSLKYLCSFYGLIVAILLSIIFNRSKAKNG